MLITDPWLTKGSHTKEKSSILTKEFALCHRTIILSNNNKDHQRMMVDPMFMIVHSLRSFLTTVTTTAVALIAVILPEFT